MFVCETHHADSECDIEHMTRSWGACELCAVLGEGAGHASVCCYDCHYGPTKTSLEKHVEAVN